MGPAWGEAAQPVGGDPLQFVVAALFDRLAARQALLWSVGPTGLELRGRRGVAETSSVATLTEPPAAPDVAGLFDGPPRLLRFPADQQQAAMAVLAITSDLPADGLQREFEAAARVLALPTEVTHNLLEAISDEAAVLDPTGAVLQANRAWLEAPATAAGAVERSAVGVDYPGALTAQKSRSARICAEGLRSVLSGALPSFQSDYDTGERAYSLQADALPTGGAVVRHIDISFRKHLQRQLAHRATHDSLTGLPNRMVMMDRLGQALIRAARTHSGVALLFCDVDRFKQINDSLGHTVGDQVLVAIARRLQNCARQSDVVARFGGDEFVVLLEDVDSEALAVQFAHDLQSAATVPIVVDGRPLEFGLSVGVAVHTGSLAPESGELSSLLADSDAAMYAAKLAGRGTICVFEPSHRQARRDPATIAPALRTAALNDEIRMLVQPIVDLADASVLGFESFVRWDLPEVGRLSPADFLQTAEETGAIVEIGQSILRQTLDFARALPEPLRVSVNVSWPELSEPDFCQAVRDAARAAGVPLRRLELEILLPASADDQVLERLHRLRDEGVGLTLDAFGRQPLELSMITRIHASTLKIDRTLTALTTRPPGTARILAGVVGLADRLGLSCIAEGIETRAQAEAAMALGLRCGQGFYFGKPVDPEEALAAFE